MVQLRTFVLLGGLVLLVATGGCVNRPPTLNCAAERTTLTEGQSVTIEANATDDGKDPLTFKWAATNGMEKDAVKFSTRSITPKNGSAVYDSGEVFEVNKLPRGRYTVKAEVSDAKHTVSCSVDLIVEKNKQAPSVACNPARSNVTEGQSKTLRVQASDPNDDAMTYKWSVDGRDVPTDQTSFEFGTSGRSVGAHTVRVSVTDSDGMSSNCDFNVTIDRRPNRNPTVALTVDSTQVFAGQSVAATAQGSDPDGDPLSYSWSIDGQSRPGSSAQYQVNTGGLAGGTHTVAVTVQDDRGGSGSATKSFSVTEKIVIQMRDTRLDNIGKAKLDEVALKLQQNPQLQVKITGHTDDRGSESANQRVGQRRAEAAKKYLVSSHKIDDSRISAGSAGESMPMSANSTDQGRAENRRVEVELSMR